MDGMARPQMAVTAPARSTPAPIRMLVLSPFPEQAAGTRFRISHYVPYLEAHGFEVTVDAFFTSSFFRLLYEKRHYLKKAFRFGGLALRRLAVVRQAGHYDLIFIYREAFPVGPPFVERYLASRGSPIVLDFDDAIYLSNTSEANRFAASLKYVRKVSTLVRLSTRVIVGNEYLAQYARQHNPAVTVIPTCVDTTRFVPRSGVRPDGPIVVGWIGSPTTTPYLEGLSGVLRSAREQHPFVVRVSGAAGPLAFDGVEIRDEPWSLDREVELFNTCDVGVYPLTDDEWARGKCGFKAIQFMACGVPVVASPVGVNQDIIQDGVNGFLAATPDEWVRKLGRLLAEPELRARFAEAGRRTIEERYSLRVHAPHFADTLRAAARSGARA
jgi:glycosyltransferase involved in cell wall biosynthesis